MLCELPLEGKVNCVEKISLNYGSGTYYILAGSSTDWISQA